MTYKETLDYLDVQLPMYHRIGAAAYKADLNKTWTICNLLGNPQHAFRSVHIAGTNGKGSTSHMLASIMQEKGLKTGLYTSPHLTDFLRLTQASQPLSLHRGGRVGMLAAQSRLL